MNDNIFLDGEEESLLKAVRLVVKNHPCTVSQLTSAIYQLGRLASDGLPPYMVVGILEKLMEEKRVNANE